MPPHDDSVDREGGKTWSGNFHHDGRTAFQVRHRKADHGGVPATVEWYCSLPTVIVQD